MSNPDATEPRRAVEPPIERIPILPLGMVNAYCLIGETGCVVVDAGLPDTVEKFERGLRRHRRELRDVSLIVVTHGHVDHAGGAKQLAEATGAPVLAHRDELPFLRGDRPMTYCPTSRFGRWFLRTGVPKQPSPAFDADIVVEDEAFDLAPFGVQGQVLATPGHTPGSVSVVLPSGSALVGDMLASGVLLGGIFLTGRAMQPPFEERPHEVADEIERLVSQGAQRFVLGHGGPLPAAEALRHARKLRELPALPAAASGA